MNITVQDFEKSPALAIALVATHKQTLYLTDRITSIDGKESMTLAVAVLLPADEFSQMTWAARPAAPQSTPHRTAQGHRPACHRSRS